MIKIDNEKCIGCGQCVKECFPIDIEIKDGKAVPKNDKCFECGHCVAVCPANAVTLLGYDMDEVDDLWKMNYEIAPEVVLDQMKARRTIRRFKDKKVSYDQIKMILEAGRYSPTGGNRQTVAYNVLQDSIPEIREMVIDQLKVMGDKMLAAGQKRSFYTEMWLDMYDDFHQNGKDRIFFDAGTVIVISSDDPISAGLAAGHMETMIYAMGLGCLYSGFSRFAIDSSEELQKKLKMKDGYHAQIVMVIGYPDVRYRRSVPRKKAEVEWD